MRETKERAPLDVIESAPGTGLTEAQAAERRRLGYANEPVQPPGKTVGQIVFSNVCTWFNLIFVLLAAALIAVRSWNNLMFLGVVLSNTAIGIVQELRSKRVLDRLNLLTAQRVPTVREGVERELLTEELVRDDVIRVRGGDQICADAVLLSGACRVNEALITGEPDEIAKSPGDELRSGSFAVSGDCYVRLTAVGADSYANRITLAAREGGRGRESEMMRSLRSLVKWIGLLLLPLGGALLLNELLRLHGTLEQGVVSTVAALLGMIPEGLYLLTSLALVAGVLRLAKRGTLVHELKSIETLARVDVLCVDKTGTITENAMAVEELVCLGGASEDFLKALLGDYAAALGPENDTMRALAAACPAGAGRTAVRRFPFTSAKKYGAAVFTSGETVYLGAPELLKPGDAALEEKCAAASERGCRALLLAAASTEPDEARAPAPEDLKPLALILLRNPIRAEAPETFRYFAEQGVAVKVISGDDPRTVSRVAQRAGIAGAEHWVDARTLGDGDALREAMERYTVFGRVTPERKRAMVRALKAAGHTAAMTGDGVNDVLALKDADCSVAMASGSDAACRVSDLVLLHNDFSVLPSVVAEGRRVINNIERSATLFLMKNVLSLLLSLSALLLGLSYPFAPVQMTLIGGLTIGFPAFVLALEPNENRIQGRFLPNVFRRAVPPALTDYLLILASILLAARLGLPREEMSTVAVYLMSAVGFLVVGKLCRPFNALRLTLLGAMALAYAFVIVLLPGWFSLAPLSASALWLLLALAAVSWPLLEGVTRLWSRLLNGRGGVR